VSSDRCFTAVVYSLYLDMMKPYTGNGSAESYSAFRIGAGYSNSRLPLVWLHDGSPVASGLLEWTPGISNKKYL